MSDGSYAQQQQYSSAPQIPQQPQHDYGAHHAPAQPAEFSSFPAQPANNGLAPQHYQPPQAQQSPSQQYSQPPQPSASNDFDPSQAPQSWAQVDGKDPNLLKLFVGMIPRHMSEADLRPLFEPFGEIVELSVLADQPGFNKGSGFVTFKDRESGQRCMEVLNGKHTLPGGPAPLQVRPAERKGAGDDRKLFVASLALTTTDEDLKQLFDQHGKVEEWGLVRRPDGSNTRCGLVKFSTRVEALVAIDKLNGKITLPGNTMPLIVRFVETQAEKQARKMLKAGAIPGQGYGAPQPPQQQYPGYPGYPGYPQQQGGYPGYPGYGYPQGGQSDPYAVAYQGVQQFNASGYGNQPYAQQSPYGAAPAGYTTTPNRNVGPDDAAVFIGSLPPDATIDGMRALFSPFGAIANTSILRDKMTGLNKNAGFVNFENAASASQAVAKMNMFNWNGSILKVSMKTPKRPY